MILDIAIGLGVGLSLGLTGGGGSIIAVPLLIYVAGLSIQEAVPLSLIAVSATSLLGLLLSLRSGVVIWRAGLIFSVGGILAAPVGPWLAHFLSEDIRLISFAILMLIVGANMWRKAANEDTAAVVRGNADSLGSGMAVCRFSGNETLDFTASCALVLAASGAIVGILAGLFGVGGGFLIVPALIFVVQMNMPSAVGTSLLAITLIGAATAISTVANSWHVISGQQNLILYFLTGSLIGMGLGRVLARKIAGAHLQKLFALMVLSTAASVLIAR